MATRTMTVTQSQKIKAMSDELKSLYLERDEMTRRIKMIETDMTVAKKQLMSVATLQQAKEAVFCACCDRPILAYCQSTEMSSRLIAVESFFAQTPVQRSIHDCKHTVCYGCASKSFDIKACPKCKAHVLGIEKDGRTHATLCRTLDKYRLQCPFDGCEKYHIKPDSKPTEKYIKSSYIDIALHYGKEHLSIPGTVQCVPGPRSEFISI